MALQCGIGYPPLRAMPCRRVSVGLATLRCPTVCSDSVGLDTLRRQPGDVPVARWVGYPKRSGETRALRAPGVWRPPEAQRDRTVNPWWVWLTRLGHGCPMRRIPLGGVGLATLRRPAVSPQQCGIGYPPLQRRATRPTARAVLPKQSCRRAVSRGPCGIGYPPRPLAGALRLALVVRRPPGPDGAPRCGIGYPPPRCIGPRAFR